MSAEIFDMKLYKKALKLAKKGKSLKIKPISCVEYERENQIQIDAEQIIALQKQNGELTDKVKELEAEKDKAWWEGFDTCKAKAGEANVKLSDEIILLKAQIEKMKCCPNCDFVFRDGLCYYDKECKNKDHWKLRR